MAFRDLSGAVDFAWLEAYARNDTLVIEEVLNLFVQQAEIWSSLLDISHPGWRDAAHTLKGTAASIGAQALAKAAEAAERGDEHGAAARLEKVRDALDAALMDVAAYLHGVRLKGLRAQ